MKKVIKKSKAGKVIKDIAVAGAVAGAAYMLMGPDGKKNQAKLKKFAGKMKVEAMKDVKMLMNNVGDTKKMVMKDTNKAKKMVMKDMKMVKKVVVKNMKKVKKMK